MRLTIAHLYPNLMSIYGDQGNLDTLVFRCRQRGIIVKIMPIHPQTALKAGSFDLLFAGGGQDRQQLIITPDLLAKKAVIAKAFQANIPMLTICGSYQLFGRYFQPYKNKKLKGLGIFNLFTKASKQRKIGNIVIKTNLLNPSTVIGFENHSGNTFLADQTQAFGQVFKGFGNNGLDKTEGIAVRRAIGCYLHGSLLPKNPHLADHLIKQALANKYGSVKISTLDDRLEWQAHQQTIDNRTKKNSRPLLKYILAKKPGW